MVLKDTYWLQGVQVEGGVEYEFLTNDEQPADQPLGQLSWSRDTWQDLVAQTENPVNMPWINMLQAIMGPQEAVANPQVHDLRDVDYNLGEGLFVNFNHVGLAAGLLTYCVNRTLRAAGANYHEPGDYLLRLSLTGVKILTDNQGMKRTPIPPQTTWTLLPNLRVFASPASMGLHGQQINLASQEFSLLIYDALFARILQQVQAWEQHAQNGHYMVQFLISGLQVSRLRSRVWGVAGFFPPVGCSSARNRCTQQYIMKMPAPPHKRVTCFTPKLGPEHKICLFFPFFYPRFRGELTGKKKTSRVNYGKYLVDQKRRVYRQMGRSGEELEDLMGMMADASDPHLMFTLIEMSHLHAVIFVPDHHNRNQIVLAFDSRDPRQGDMAYFGRRWTLQQWKDKLAVIQAEGYVSFIIRDNHVYPILSDTTSAICKFQTWCKKCRVKFDMAETHTCNSATASFNARRFDRHTIPDSITHMTSLDGQITVESDGNMEFPSDMSVLTGGDPISLNNKKFGDCPFAKGENLCYFDMETYFPPERAMEAVVYAVGAYMEGTATYHEWFGVNALSDFCKFLTQQPEAQLLISYNGSRFDNLFLAQAALTMHGQNMLPRKIMVNAGALLGVDFTYLPPGGTVKQAHKVWDLCKFTMCALADACKAYGCEIQKSRFPHLFAKKEEDLYYRGPGLAAENYFPKDREGYEVPAHFDFQDECLRYLKLDVMGMRECHKKLEASFNESFSGQLGENITLTKFVSLSQVSLALCNWQWARQTIPVYAPNGNHAYRVFASGYLGGRVFVGARKFYSHNYEAVKAAPPEQRYEMVNDYCSYWDFTSLYPFVMQDYPYPFGRAHFVSPQTLVLLQQKLSTPEGVRELIDAVDPWYQTSHEKGDGEWKRPLILEEGLYETLPFLEKFVCAYWEVSFEPPKNLRFPYHMYKTKSGRLKSDLYPNRQWVYMPDFMAMLKVGYKITQIHRVIVWASFGKILREMILWGKRIKEDGEREKNKIKRKIGKDLLNSLYGKFGQSVKDEVIEVITSIMELVKFTDNHIWADLNIFQGERGSFTMVKGVQKENRITPTKPTYLAGFVTAYSRYHNRINVIEEILAKDPGFLYMYHDTDSHIIHCSATQYIPPHWRGTEFGQLKDELGGTPQQPAKIVRCICLGKKCYFIEYLTPDGRLTTVSTVKGLTGDVPQEDFEAILLDPKTKRTYNQEDSLQKTIFAPEATTLRKLQERQEKHHDLPPCEGEDSNCAASFRIFRREHVTRSVNATPFQDSFVVMDSANQNTLPFGHEAISTEARKAHEERFAPYVYEEAKRYNYKSATVIELSDQGILEGLRAPELNADYDLDLEETAEELLASCDYELIE